MLSKKLGRPLKELPPRYVRALRALKLAAKPFAKMSCPEAFAHALKAVASDLRPATWCEYRRAAVLECERRGFAQAAVLLQDMKQADFGVARKKNKKRITITAAEKDALASAAKKKGDQAILFSILLCWRYGLRAAELPRLAVQDNYLFVASAKKTGVRGSDRRFKIANQEIEIVTRVAKLLSTETSEKLRARLYRLGKKVFPKNKIGITFHRIRHQVASDLKSSKVDIISIAKILGHRSCKSTNLYGDPRRGSSGRGAPPVEAEFEPRPAPGLPPRTDPGATPRP